MAAVDEQYTAERLEAQVFSFEDAQARRRPRATGQQQPPAEWPDPQPLKNPLPPVPAFDVQLLPSDLRIWIVDIATRMQVPIEMIAVAAMSALSVVASSARTIHPKRFDDWRVYPVLWGVAIAPAGSKKTPSMKEAQRPLDMLDAIERKRWADDGKRREAALLVAKARQDAAAANLKKAAQKGYSSEELEDIASRAVQKPEEDFTVRPRRYTSQDTTTEKISDLVNRAGEGKRSYPLGIMRDELIGLLQTFDRDGREGDRAFYLEGWSVGDKQIDRIGRGEIFVKDLCLVVFGNATPGPFEAYVREATSGPDADGFLQRLQMAVYPDPIADLRYVDQPVDHLAFNRALGVFERLAQIREEDKRGKPPALRFTDDAQVYFEQWFVGLERWLARSEDHHAVVSHFSKYRSLMPALALVLHLAAAPGNENEPVSIEAAKQAAAWCAFLTSHAKRIYSIAGHPERVAAQAILKRVQAGKLSGEVKLRALERDFRSYDAETLRAAVEFLEDHGWCRSSIVKGAGRPSERVTFNPKANAKGDAA